MTLLEQSLGERTLSFMATAVGLVHFENLNKIFSFLGRKVHSFFSLYYTKKSLCQLKYALKWNMKQWVTPAQNTVVIGHLWKHQH